MYYYDRDRGETWRLVYTGRHVRRECMVCVGSALSPRDLMEKAAVIEHEALVDTAWRHGIKHLKWS